MRLTSNIWFSVLMTFFIISCNGGSSELSRSELKWIDPYNVGDTLIFRSTGGRFDTSIIIKKEVFYEEYNAVEVSTKRAQWGVVWYKNKNLKYNPKGDMLVTLIKGSSKESTLRINYLYGGTFGINLLSDSLQGLKHGKVYTFDTYHMKGDFSQPKLILWNEDFGIIEYITHDDIVWKRINLPNK